jgi:16S rRNA (cytosine1402-N4)-methyltransferase
MNKINIETSEFNHIPVLKGEVIASLLPKDGGIYLDGTLGGGNHAAAILEASFPSGILIGLDCDEDALKAARSRLAVYNGRVHIMKSNFAQMEEAVAKIAPAGIDGILLDIGVSSFQLDNAGRGFSYMQDAPLDMRMDKDLKSDAKTLVNTASEAELTDIIFRYGEENWARRIVKFIIEERNVAPIETTLQLVEIIKKAIPVAAREKGQHPAKRSFQALRIAVNGELKFLEQGIDAAIKILKPGGRLVIISFHSLEDRIVKDKFRLASTDCVCPPSLPVCVCNHHAEVKIISRKPILPTTAEIEQNPRARSAKLRVVEKI